jgi:type IV secretion system protein TrbL
LRAGPHGHRLGHHDGELLAAGPAGENRHRRGAPILEQIGEMAGFPEVFVNLDPIVVMFLAWLVVVLCFFVLAIQLFITLIEFKLTTLAGFVLVPFALWNKTAFLAEKVLGNVVSSGVKVLVLAVIVGIGSGLFAQFQVHPAEPSIDHALVIMLASLTLLALGIFGPGIATGLVSGAPQLGAGAMAGAAVGAAGTAVAGRRRRDGRGWRRGCWGAHGPGCRQAGR